MVGHIEPGVKSSDWYYLSRWQTLKYLLTGHLPHQQLGNKWVEDMNSGKITPKPKKKEQ